MDHTELQVAADYLEAGGFAEAAERLRAMSLIDPQQIVEWLKRVDAERVDFAVSLNRQIIRIEVLKNGQTYGRSVSLDELRFARNNLMPMVIYEMEHQVGVPTAERLDDIGRRTRPFPSE